MNGKQTIRWNSLVGLILIALLIGLIYLGPFRFFIVISGSMEPKISTGSLILVDQSRRVPEPGDIISFCQGDTVVTHRVIRVTREGYMTKGDANKREDDGIAKQAQVIGTCIGNVPFVGYLFFWLRTRSGKLLICFLAVEWILIRTLLRRRRYQIGHNLEKERES